MSVKKIVFGVFASLFIFLLFSCNLGVSDDMYILMGKRNSSTDEGILEIMPSDDDEDETLPEGQYDPFTQGAHNDINYGGFDGNKIKDYVFKASFDGKNVPTYNFVYKLNGWKLEDPKTKKSFYDGSKDGNKAQGYDISPAKFYRYDGYNPLTGKIGKKMDRFLFFAMFNSQSGGGAVTLNNYLIAVDTYSKLVFAYGKITKTRNVLGQDLPTAFEAVEKHFGKKKFYEYDPIGAVKLEGNNLMINLYAEYRNEMAASAVNFFPSIHDQNRPVATYDKAGLSPYYYVEDLSSLPQFLQNVASKSFSSREKKSYQYDTNYTGSKQTIYVTNGNDVIKTDWEFSSNGKSLTYVKKDELKGTSEEKSYTFANEIDDTSAKYKYTEGTEEKEITFKLDGTKLLEGGNELGDSSFVDPGADFILRVRGMKYVKVVNQNGRKTVVYEFSADGGTLTTKNMTGREIGDAFSGSGTYYFVEQKAGNSASALYQWTGNSIKIPYISIPIYKNPYFGVDLLEDGYKQIKRTRASSDKNAWDEDLGTFSNLPVMAKNYFSGESEVATRTNDSIVPDEITISDFTMQVASLTFKNRPQVSYTYSKNAMNIGSAKGDGLELHEYEFSDDGKILTFTTTEWETNKKLSKEYKVIENQTVTNVTSAKYVYKSPLPGVSNEEVTVGYDYEKGKLTFNGATVAYDVFTDRGPAFVLRVRGKAYKDRDRDRYYWFDDYGTLTDSENNKKYYFVQEDSSTRAVFQQEGATVLKYYGIRLTGVTDTDNSATNIGNTLYWTDGDGWASPETTPTKTAGTYVSYLSTNFIDYVKGKSFAYTSGGVEYKWSFSSDGKMATKYQNGTEVRKLEWIKSDGGSGKYGPSNNPVTFTRRKQADRMCIRAENNGEQANYFPK